MKIGIGKGARAGDGAGQGRTGGGGTSSGTAGFIAGRVALRPDSAVGSLLTMGHLYLLAVGSHTVFQWEGPIPSPSIDVSNVHEGIVIF